MDLIGHTFGQYRLARLIGRGGMAQVYQGVQANLDRDVAIKVIPARIERPSDHDSLNRFIAEARTLGRLPHPYVVPIFDFGVDSDWAYLIMEYITGGSLRDHLVAADQQNQRPRMPWALMILEQAALALDFAHQNHVVHRDVKPANMLLRHPYLMLLSDFGVATLLHDRTIERGQPQVVGTPQYMAPEQCRADARLDGRCDIYSLGVVLFQCAVGQLPFRGTQEEVMRQQVYEPTPRPTAIADQITPHVERIILTAMQKDPGRRYQRAADMAAELHAARVEMEVGQGGQIRQAQPEHRLASPTLPVSVAIGAPAGQAPAPAMHAQPATPPQEPRGAPSICFRCGAANPPGMRYCNFCRYDMAAHRTDNDHYLASNGRPLRCRLAFRTGPFARRALILHQDVTTIGRDTGNELMLPDETISRQHARLTFMGGQWVIEDIHSQNGVFVNNKRVRRALALAHRDLIRCGAVEMVFELVS
ncbi:MAG TPA: protein kinase [Ktedonobacterales bacterium]|nr:protein kinase [Ktedonobacterales bacterium]